MQWVVGLLIAALKFTPAHAGLSLQYRPTPQALTRTRTLATRLARENLRL